MTKTFLATCQVTRSQPCMAHADTVNTTVNGTKANTAAGSDELLAANKLDASDFNGGVAAQSIGIVPRAGTSGVPSATGTANPLQIIARMARKLDEQNVDSRGRWIVIDPVLKEILMDEESRLLDADFGGSGLQNGFDPEQLAWLSVCTCLTTYLFLVLVHQLLVVLTLLTWVCL